MSPFNFFMFNIIYYTAAFFLQHFEIWDNYTKLLYITQEKINLIRLKMRCLNWLNLYRKSKPINSGKIAFILSEDNDAPRTPYPLSYCCHPCCALDSIRSQIQAMDQAGSFWNGNCASSSWWIEKQGSTLLPRPPLKPCNNGLETSKKCVWAFLLSFTIQWLFVFNPFFQHSIVPCGGIKMAPLKTKWFQFIVEFPRRYNYPWNLSHWKFDDTSYCEKLSLPMIRLMFFCQRISLGFYKLSQGNMVINLSCR